MRQGYLLIPVTAAVAIHIQWIYHIKELSAKNITKIAIV